MNNSSDPKDDHHNGIWFFGGVQSTIPMVLVSNGYVRIEHYNNFTGSDAKTEIPYLSIFAQHAAMGGPEPPQIVRVTHDPLHPFDQSGGLIDQLCDSGYLPNSSGLGVTFAGIPGTWKELDPDDPPPVSN